MILACVEPIRADPLAWQSWYVTCDFCHQSACEDIWAGRLAEESWRLFYAVVGEGLVVCEHCLPRLEEMTHEH
jgi:hypothetical protein